MAVQRRRGSISIGLIVFLLAFGLVTQIQSQARPQVSLLEQPEADLAEIVDRLEEESDRVRNEIEELRLREARYEAASGNQRDILAQARQNLRNLRILAGSAVVEGPGVRMVVRDKNSFLTGFDLRQVVEELRASGAAAVAVNGQRVLTNSSFSRKSGRVYLDGKRLSKPYEIVAAGNAGVLYQALTLPRGVTDRIEAFKGVDVRVTREKKLAVGGGA